MAPCCFLLLDFFSLDTDNDTFFVNTKPDKRYTRTRSMPSLGVHSYYGVPPGSAYHGAQQSDVTPLLSTRVYTFNQNRRTPVNQKKTLGHSVATVFDPTSRYKLQPYFLI